MFQKYFGEVQKNMPSSPLPHIEGHGYKEDTEGTHDRFCVHSGRDIVTLGRLVVLQN